MLTSRHASLAAAALLGLAACAGGPATGPDQDAAARQAAETDPRRGESVDRVCFVSSINGFTETTRRSVVI